ncbi:MAG: universal stress protein [Lewinellaceae bacterium]|nr:universal stress protein [Lewinellaceae bacterium]
MKKILVPTDFSLVADNALKHAIEIAEKFKSKLYLYHVYSFDRFNYDLNFDDDEQPFAKEMERNMKKTKLKFIDVITQKGLSVQTMVERDNIFSLFGSSVKKHEFDLIIMGSKGCFGARKGGIWFCRSYRNRNRKSSCFDCPAHLYFSSP